MTREGTQNILETVSKIYQCKFLPGSVEINKPARIVIYDEQVKYTSRSNEMIQIHLKHGRIDLIPSEGTFIVWIDGGM